ncbi:osomolarity two-component system, phosphorelay intermediate protein YPD1 [Cryptococcus neoformans C23]|uniref:Osomolarity two-component system, phosphorelay intermediate protein YPD1 n=3 Tax=Cryptococcus neoformans TaxID=5207 RepID=A0A854Q2I7_CRYNE|nr:osomolarity two-component system, phosphorelay intermediate protein YPD1 [Cryptococcus neoformans var. grubii H99]AEI59121.1 histidine-containing phosphotransfer protein [Cryptococcus neoformans var. grubii]OWZ27186.1 osomolarity two-component system, phosphorelay intermediate protein YPD1 [Cryptococcus neoformans var. grubii AD2-60a]OWZ28812.1 osomolarity two-component system, phosphorelay intermediate protein YPD1 [Cryptococcus neoformans var. grubii AD1-83a]OWZ39148.1 osomolarity two-comp|eukprot:XP_012053169.1 osomolarity two-component system, phosphorelay intermediate protein YPD1 [Cryptococcus neoformans var. grubii H99]
MPDQARSPSAPATTSNISDRQHTQPQPAKDDKSQQADVKSPESSREQSEQVEEEAAAEADDESDDEEPETGDEIIDMETFQQIMDMDEEDEVDEDSDEKHSFSKGIVWGYFTQAEETFKDMEDALSRKDLSKLSSLGHFLKGSSAALGIIKVQASCEKMQHYGNLRDEEAGADLDDAEALKRIDALLVKCKKDYKAAKNWMVKMYDDLK